MRELFLEEDEISLILNILPNFDAIGEANLPPEFYHTMSYEGDVKLKAVIESLREKLEEPD